MPTLNSNAQEDSWFWAASSSGSFSVKSVYLLDQGAWCKWLASEENSWFHPIPKPELLLFASILVEGVWRARSQAMHEKS
ncbi:hypothetical protein TorRG33x02_258650 [Trema orientale]|uniref:Uncharacterized protein n=1 Tax=Trema orientale TaxID=63057 RepID=A0A2P5D8S2_TREOI|nr:hypothetical protein TorRG33x02_258650 [Trema orientale]